MTSSIYDSFKYAYVVSYILGLSPFPKNVFLNNIIHGRNLKHYSLFLVNSILSTVLYTIQHMTYEPPTLSAWAVPFSMSRMTLLYFKNIMVLTMYVSAALYRGKYIRLINLMHRMDYTIHNEFSLMNVSNGKRFYNLFVITITPTPITLAFWAYFYNTLHILPTVHSYHLNAVTMGYLSVFLIELRNRVICFNQYFDRVVKSMENPETVEESMINNLKLCSKFIDDVWEASGIVNECFQAPILMILFHLLFRVLSVLFFIAIKSTIPFPDLLFAINLAFLDLYVCYIFLYNFAQIKKKVYSCNEILYSIRTRSRNQLLLDIIRIFSYKFKIRKMNFTVYQMFSLDYGVIYMVVTTSLTYAVYLYQIK